MSEKDMERNPANAEQSETASEKKTEIEHLVEDFKVRTISSAEMIKGETLQAETLPFGKTGKDIPSSKSGYLQLDGDDLSEKEIDSLIERSPVFKELSEPKLPELPKENRARLQMQSPNRLYFYWSTKNNPFQTLNSVFGGNAGIYTLVAKLVNQTQNSEEIVPIEAAGATWFDVDANSIYRAEIGFYAAHRPFVRLMFSNIVETPRKSPSPRSDFSLDWAVSSNQFAQVLDVSGYAHDAIEVALAGDDSEFAEIATRNAFAQVTGKQEFDFTEDNSSEIRFVLLALASGYLVENLRGQISKNLFAKLLENAENLSAEKALNALQENFGEFADETIQENSGQTVFGTSSINFPRFSKRRVLPKFAPISSLNFVR
jgi:hypothetical protein